MNDWRSNEDRYADRWQRGQISRDIWRYIPESVRAGVTDAFADSDGYWIFLDHESSGWVAYDGGEDCGIIHEYTIEDLRKAVKTIRKEG